MALPQLLGSIGKGLLSAGKGLGTAAQYGTVGSKYKHLGRAISRPIRGSKGLEGQVTGRNLLRIGMAGQGIGWLTLPTLMRRWHEQSPEEQWHDEGMVQARGEAQRADAMAQLKRIEFNRRERAIKSEEEKLKRIAPHLYNRISAGQDLPRGAVVIGGAPRRDLLRELSEAMHDDAFKQPAEGSVNISNLLQ